MLIIHYTGYKHITASYSLLSLDQAAGAVLMMPVVVAELSVGLTHLDICLNVALCICIRNAPKCTKQTKTEPFRISI